MSAEMAGDPLPVRVGRGAVFLDDNNPGWASRVDRPAIDMASVTDDVLGQLYDRYEEGLDQLGLYGDAVEAYGFELNASEVRDGSGSYEQLRDLWCAAADVRTETTEI